MYVQVVIVITRYVRGLLQMLFGNRILVGYIIIQLVFSHAPAWFGLFLLLLNDRMLL